MNNDNDKPQKKPLNNDFSYMKDWSEPKSHA